MKYFTSSLWAALNSQSKEQQIAADKQWNDAFSNYRKQWQRVKRDLPSDFVNFYEKYSFHDAPIKECIFGYCNKLPIVRMNLTIDKYQIMLLFSNVESYRVSLIDFSNCILNQLAWGYGEFEYLPSHQFKLSVLCDINNEIEIVFKKLEWEILEQHNKPLRRNAAGASPFISEIEIDGKEEKR